MGLFIFWIVLKMRSERIVVVLRSVLMVRIMLSFLFYLMFKLMKILLV